MKKQTPKITLLPWQADGFKNGSKTQMTFLADPQPAPGDILGSDAKTPLGFSYYRGKGIPAILVKNPLSAKFGDIVYCKEHRLHLEITDQVAMYGLDHFTDEDAIAEGIGMLYPKSDFGGDGFYLPDQIIEASALDCFKDYWNKQPGNEKYPFESNPYVITFTMKIVKL